MHQEQQLKPTHRISLWLTTPAHIVEFLSNDDSIRGLLWEYIWRWSFEKIQSNTYSTDRIYYKNTSNWIIFSFPKGWLKPNTAYTIYIAWKWESPDWKLEIWDFRIHPNYEDDSRSDPRVVELWKSMEKLWKVMTTLRNKKFTLKSINIEVSANQDFTPKEKVIWAIDRFARRVVNVVYWMSQKLWKKWKWKKR